MDSEITAQEEDVDEGQVLRAHLFEAELIQLPPPEDGPPDMLPEWFTGSLPALIYPPIQDRGLALGENIDLQITPYHLYYGALRELAETADAARAELLRQLVLGWNPQAALEVTQLARQLIESDVANALLHYELAMELDESFYEAHQDAGMCHFALAGIDGEDREDRLSTAEELFRRAIELRPHAGLSWWSLARVLNEMADGAAALGALQQFLSEYPEGEQREMVEDALHHGFEVHQEGPGPDQQARAQFLEAQSLLQQDPARAVELLEPLTEAYPDSGELWFVLGSAHRHHQHPTEAERCLRRAARLAPQEPFIWWQLAGACTDLREWKEAEEAIRKALEPDPDNPIYLCDLGRILLAQGDREGAEDAIHRARDLVPDDPGVQEALAALSPS